jgi:hypothetical protein
MSMTDSQLVTQANIIKNETAAGANTATRVGTTLDDIITNKINNDKIAVDGTLAANSDTLVASQKATKTYVDGKVTTINGTIASGLALKENTANKSVGPLGVSAVLFPTESSVSTALVPKENISDKVTTQGTFISNGTSVVKYPAVKAVKDYVDGVTVGLLKDNGNYDPTVTSNFPTSANTLSGGPIQVGDLWYISANGTMNSNAVLVGYSVRALVNAAGATNNADWAISNVGLGFVPENSANKSNDGTFNSGSPSSTLFPTQAAVAAYLNTVPVSDVQSITVTLDNAAITSGAPMQILPAPGAGKFIDVISVKSIFTPGGTPLTSPFTNGQIKYGTLGAIDISSTVLTINGVSWFTQYPLNPPTTSQQLPFVENDPIVLSLNTAMTGGVGNTIKVYITYRIVTI